MFSSGLLARTAAYMGTDAIQGRRPQRRCWQGPPGFRRWDDVPRWRGLLAVLPGATWDVFVLKLPLGC